VFSKLIGVVAGGPEGAAATGIVGAVKGIIDAVHLDPAKKAELDSHLADIAAQAEQADKDLEGKLNDIAGQNIRTDSSSSDSVVRRARPIFLWIMAIAIGTNLLVFPLVSLATGHGLKPIDIPQTYLDIYKICMLGYTAARSVEKITNRA
jgi:hypothetical protein